MDPSLLPTPFTSACLWAVCLQDQRFGGLQEGLVLADPGPAGLEVLRQTYPEAGPHALLMAFSLEQLEQLEHRFHEGEATDGALQAKAAAPERDWPQWQDAHAGSYLVLQTHENDTCAHWVRALSRSQALMAAKTAKPDHIVLTVGDLNAFSSQVQGMRKTVERQDFGSVWTDLRRQATHPASRAQIAAYPLAAAGLFSTPQEAMAHHQALFLEALNEESWSD